MCVLLFKFYKMMMWFMCKIWICKIISNYSCHTRFGEISTVLSIAESTSKLCSTWVNLPLFTTALTAQELFHRVTLNFQGWPFVILTRKMISALGYENRVNLIRSAGRAQETKYDWKLILYRYCITTCSMLPIYYRLNKCKPYKTHHWSL